MQNITHVQALILAFLCSLILVPVYCLIFGGTLTSISKILFPFIFVVMVGTIMGYGLLFIQFIHPRKDREQFEKAHNIAKQEVLDEYNLNDESYTEVKLIFGRLLSDVDEDLTDVILPLLNNSNFRFFAKLIDDEDGYIDNAIEVIVKGNNDNLIHTITISNFIYFQANFEKLN